MSTNVEALTHEECISLLEHNHLGRIAVVVGNQPVVFPVTYAFDVHAVVFRTDPGTKLFGALRGPVAFEVDGNDGDGSAWSVVITGRAELVSNEADIHRLSSLELGAWDPGPKQHWVRLRGTITGRRLVHLTAR